jgi:hypothetical protein
VRLATVPKDMGRDSIGSLEEDTKSGIDSSEEGERSDLSLVAKRENSNDQACSHVSTNNYSLDSNLPMPCTNYNVLKPHREDVECAAYLSSSLLSLAADGSMTPITPRGERNETNVRRVVFCDGDELPIDIVEGAVEISDATGWIPRALLDAGLKVQNTFFNVPPELPTPFVKSASIRSRSLPNTFGGSCRIMPNVTNHKRSSSGEVHCSSTCSPQTLASNMRLQRPTLLSPSFHGTPTMNKFPQTPW